MPDDTVDDPRQTIADLQREVAQLAICELPYGAEGDNDRGRPAVWSAQIISEVVCFLRMLWESNLPPNL
jgi:hypothetical protein